MADELTPLLEALSEAMNEAGKVVGLRIVAVPMPLAEALEEAGVLYRTSMGTWQMGIPPADESL